MVNNSKCQSKQEYAETEKEKNSENQDYTFYLAPLQGLTNYLFRKVYKTHFNRINTFFAPYVTGNTGKALTRTRLKEVLPENNAGIDLVPQILIRSVKEFEYITPPICELGYTQININMGCPFPMAVKKGRGAGLLPHYREVDSILEKADKAEGLDISVKIRLGQSEKNDIYNLIDVFNNHTLKEVIIHPRTADQLYDGPIDLSLFGQVSQQIEHPVVYNGDIYSEEIFQVITGRFGNISRFMLGRGLLINPCLAEELQKGAVLPGSEKKKRIKSFMTDLFSLYSSIMSGEKHTLDKMKGYWTYLALLFEKRERVFKLISKARNYQTYNLAVEEIFSSCNLLEKSAARFSRNPLK